MTGRNDNGILVNSIGVNIQLLIEQYRKNYNYPSWFENTLGYAESGQISAQALQLAADNLLNRGDMTLKPAPKAELDKGRIEYYIEKYHGDDIKLLHQHASDFGTSLEDAKKERTSLQGKIDKLNLDSDLFHTMHTDQESRITRNAEMIGNKSDKGHKHKCEGKECEDCGWFGEKCWFDPDNWEIPTWLKLLGAAIGIGLLLWLIRPLLKIGANVTK